MTNLLLPEEVLTEHQRKCRELAALGKEPSGLTVRTKIAIGFLIAGFLCVAPGLWLCDVISAAKKRKKRGWRFSE